MRSPIPAASAQRYPLAVRDHLWRLAVMLLISGVAWSSVLWPQLARPGWLVADVLVGVLCFVLVHLRRRHPVAMALATNLAAGFSAIAAGPAALALVSLATRRRWREILPVSVLALLVSPGIEILDPRAGSWYVFVPFVVAVLAVSVGWGLYIGSRRELLATLRDRAERAEAEQTARMAQARATERTRIAREMHDVLAHRISLVTMHAGALVYRDDLTAEQVRRAAEVIQQTSHQALGELRQVLGVLREDAGDAAPEPPQPSAEDLTALLVEARRSGMNVATELADTLRDIPPRTGRTLYRIVQEGLTNARKHAPDTRVTVTVRGGPDEGIDARISNPLRLGAVPPPSSGFGLAGLTERAELAGGRLRHSIDGAGEFVLDAWLPWSS